VESEEVWFSATGVRLSGTITCPDTVPVCPGLVLIGGSGPTDRHNDGFFDALRTHLTDVGVAVLGYDKRGAGKSTGEWATATTDDLARDAAAAVAVLRAHPRVAADTVGVLGHSEGGWVALRLCARIGAVRHLIVNSCPAVSFVESEVFALIAAGAEPDTAAALMWRLTMAARAGHDHRQGQRIVSDYQNEPWYPSATAGFELDSATWAQLSAWGDEDPADDLVRLKTPTLAVFGGNDPLTPVQASVARYEETAANAGRHQQIVVFPDADHRLRITDGFAPGYMERLSAWCWEHGIP
jgi:uncharacterized protein